MTDPLQAILQPNTLKTNLFPINSRYYGIDTATLETTSPNLLRQATSSSQTSEKRTIVYLRRRFCPPPERFALLQEHMVTQGERLDNITAQYLGDPEQFWRICDANGAIRPDELTETIGRRLRITLPEGIPGVPNA